MAGKDKQRECAMDDKGSKKDGKGGKGYDNSDEGGKQ
jgi:hypothetical protein